jgi:NifU-like protein involved in Fe-S cluster formation
MSKRAYTALYNEKILALANGLVKEDRLANPQATVQVDSPLCGSSIRVDVNVDENGRLSAYGQQVRACALGQSSAALMKAICIGKSYDDIARARHQITLMLKEGGPSPEGDWSDYEILSPAHDHKSRHASVLLPFKAVLKAMEQVERIGKNEG